MAKTAFLSTVTIDSETGRQLRSFATPPAALNTHFIKHFIILSKRERMIEVLF